MIRVNFGIEIEKIKLLSYSSRIKDFLGLMHGVTKRKKKKSTKSVLTGGSDLDSCTWL